MLKKAQKTIKNKLKSWWPYQIAITAAVALLFILNYTPGTYLLGWDSLSTELNPLLGIKRAVFSAWQEYQSLGLLAGMAHASDLVRATFIALLSTILPTHAIRYVFHFLMLAIGALGMFRLAQSALPVRKRKPFISFIASIFYILNYGTVQLFAVPFEPFSIFLAFLPWQIWIFTRLIHARQKSHIHKDLILLAVINFLATPQAYVQTLFVVYSLVIAVTALAEFITARRKMQTIKRIATAGLLILAVNAFWLLPQLYFVATGGPTTVQNAKINQLATENVSYENLEFGTVESLLQFKGFYSGLENSQNNLLFSQWLEHLSNPFIQLLTGVLVLIMFYGMLQRTHHRLIMFFLYGLASFALLLNVPGLDYIHTELRTLPLIGEIFRAPFTKFISVYALSASYFFSYGLLHLYKKSAIISTYVKPSAGIALAGIIIYTLPAFQGHLIADDMQVAIPRDYLETIEFFKDVDPNKRIAMMPEHAFWGWNFTQWGYNGSGFLWYGIEQPIVSRTFDVWSHTSESYHWEVKKAVESEDFKALEKVLKKYAIDYVIVDTSLEPLNGSDKALQYDRLKKLLSQSPNLTQFGFGKHLNLYRLESQNGSDFIQLGGSLPEIGPHVDLMSYDAAYNRYGNYIIKSQDSPNAYYPFRNLFTQTRLNDKPWNMTETDVSFVFTAKIPENTNEYRLFVPEPADPIELFVEGSQVTLETELAYDITGNELTVTIPKTFISRLSPNQASIYRCGDGGDAFDAFIQDNFIRTFSNHGAIPCVSYNAPYLNQNFGYIVSVENRNLDGRRLLMSIADNTKDQAYIEERLQSDAEQFIIAPRFEFGRGYTFTFQNTSYVNIPSTNIIDNISLYYLPYQTLAEMHLIKRDAIVESGEFSTPSFTEKRAYHAYTADLSISDVQSASHVILNQAYHPGWSAFVTTQNPIAKQMPYVFGRRLSQHDYVNNWAQGWEIGNACDGLLVRSESNECRIVVLFWPQYLQYLGFAVLIAGFGYVIWTTKE